MRRAKKNPPFLLNGTFFPRDIGRMILHLVCGDMSFAWQELAFLCMRMVCTTWHAMLHIEMRLQRKGNMNRVVGNMFNTPIGRNYVSMTRLLVDTWHYPIAHNGFRAVVEAAGANSVEHFLFLLSRDKDADLRKCWYAALKHGAMDVINALLPAIRFSTALKERAFAHALYLASSVRIVADVYDFFKPDSIPTAISLEVKSTHKRWPPIFDFLAKKFSVNQIDYWQLRMIADSAPELVIQMCLYQKRASKDVCSALVYNNLHVVHSRLFSFCDCQKSTHRRSERLKKKAKTFK